MGFKRIIILGAGHEQTSAIKMCKKLNIKNIVCDQNKNAFGKIFSDKFYKCDITDYKKILKLAKKFNIDGIFTLCLDVAVPVVSKISNVLNLHNISLLTSRLSTNKSEMKKVFQSKGISTPNFDLIKNLESTINYQ